jgi:hypothetical protein
MNRVTMMKTEIVWFWNTLMMKKIILVDRVKQQLNTIFFDEMSDVEILTGYSNEDALRLHGTHRADLIMTELHGVGMNTSQLEAITT